MAASSPLRSRIHHARDSARHELDLVESAIALVASGGASRVVVVLGLGTSIPLGARSTAGQREVNLSESRRADGGRDIIVEPAA